MKSSGAQNRKQEKQKSHDRKVKLAKSLDGIERRQKELDELRKGDI